MAEQLPTPDRVVLLLSLVPYLQEHGPTTITELSEAFDADPKMLRDLVRFLGTAGVPGETLRYQHEDLFDIDWDALERDDTVSLVQAVAVDDAPRFSSVETAALLAGLHALTSMLPEPDAEIAMSAAAKLGATAGSASPLSVTAEPQDPRLPELVSAIDAGRSIDFAYRDAAGSVTERTVDPWSLTQNGGAWYLRGYCMTREDERLFRVDRMSTIRVREEPVRHQAPAARRDRAAERGGVTVVAVVRETALPRLRDAFPEIVEQTRDGRVRIRLRLGHPNAAVTLVQAVPGDIEIESPVAARDAVRVWAERALSVYGD